MGNNVWVYIAVMAAITFAIRVLPLTLIKKEIKNQTVRSFLFYLPYVTLAVMTFPAILSATQSLYSALAALLVGIVAAWLGVKLLGVSLLCCAAVLISELFL